MPNFVLGVLAQRRAFHSILRDLFLFSENRRACGIVLCFSVVSNCRLIITLDCIALKAINVFLCKILYVSR